MAYSAFYEHQRPNGSCQGGTTFTSIYKAIAPKPKKSYSAAENITYGGSASTAMGSWINSSGHLSSIISSKYNNIGIGMYEFAGKKYWVQVFMS